MSFNSLEFLLFFPAITAVYFLIPHRFRWMLLLAGSYYFYMSWNPGYILLIAFATIVNYLCGLKIASSENPSGKKLWVTIGISATLSQLFFFKYYNFFNESFQAIFGYFQMTYTVPALDILLPVGISFFTFQTLSYTIDVFRGVKEPERHIGIFALYVSFFPQLVAGPIERSTRLLPQFYEKYDFDFQRVKEGVRLMLWGLFKKIVIADRLGMLVDQVYNNATDHTGMALILATYFFAFQIFCDFSAYSDIAIGAARVMGYRLMTNFDQPFISGTVTEFWRRWHISLSTWLNDYLYTPLAIKWRNGGKYAIVAALFVTFFLSGLWHGAGWTFVIFGVLHGLGLIIEVLTKKSRKNISKKMPKWLFDGISIFICFHFVCITWIFFRANTVSDAFYIIGNLFTDLAKPLEWGDAMGMGFDQFVFSILLIMILETVHYFQRKQAFAARIFARSMAFRWALYYAMIIGIAIFGSYSYSEFIYFQF